MKKASNKKSILRNQAGQMVVETLLILVMVVGFATLVSTSFRESAFIARLVSGPWQNLSGMMQNGVWSPPDQSMSQHPLVFNRWRSPVAESSKE